VARCEGRACGHSFTEVCRQRRTASNSLLDELAPTLTDDRALTSTALPTLSRDDRRPGMTWLIGNLGHAREHMGHLRLTVQLYDAAFKPQS